MGHASATWAGRGRSAPWQRATATTPLVGGTDSVSGGSVSAPKDTREKTAVKVGWFLPTLWEMGCLCRRGKMGERGRGDRE